MKNTILHCCYPAEEFQRGIIFNRGICLNELCSALKHEATKECEGVNDTLVSVTGFNWINSLSCGKDIGVVAVK